MKKQAKYLDDQWLIDKAQPQNKDAERAVLGAIMIEKDSLDLIVTILKPDHFYTPENRKTYEAILSILKKRDLVDLINIISELEALNYLDEVGGPGYVAGLMHNVVSSAHIESHARIIINHAMRRDLIKASINILRLAYDQGEDIYGILLESENSIKAISLSNSDIGMAHISEVVKEGVSAVNEAMVKGVGVTGVTSGFSDLDKATRGWQNGDFILLGARPSVGKTALALNFIRNASKSGKTVAVWSLEMKSLYLMLRMFAAESKVKLHNIQIGKLNDVEYKELSKAAASLSNSSIWFDQSNYTTLSSIKRKARALKKKEDLGLIVIDYLQLVNPDNERDIREQQVAKISRELKILALDLNIPIIALSQLSRDSAKSISWDKGPEVSALRESGAIEQDADVIMMFWGANDEEIIKDPLLRNKRKLRLCKQRNGVLLTVEFDFRKDIQLIEMATSEEPEVITTPNNYSNFRPVKQLFDEDFNNEENPFQ